MFSVMDSKNGTLNDTTSSSALYYGVNGFGVTWDYFLINIVLFFVAGTGIILNAIALKIVSTKSPLRDVSHNFISHLAMSDIFVGLICIYTVLYHLIDYKNYYECCFRTGIATCICLNSSIHLLLITFDRYFKIKHPFKYIKHFRNEKRLRILSLSTWLFAGTLGLLPILGWRRPPIHGVEYCSYFGVLPKPYLTLMASLFFTILFIMLYCYISIVSVACKQRKGVKWQSGGDQAARSNSQRRKAVWWGPTRTVIILITLYLCCWMPTAVEILLHLAEAFPVSYTDDQKGVVLSYVTALVYLNIVANPLIYAFKIRRRKKRKSRSVINSVSTEQQSRRTPSLESKTSFNGYNKTNPSVLSCP